MGLQMDQKIDRQLIDSVLNFLKLQAEASATGIRSKSEPGPILLEAFRQSFQNGGLDEVDNLIGSINEAIESAGGTEGLGEGAALQHADGEHPAFLHIFFADLNTGRVLARESISLKQSTSAPPPD